MAQSGYYEYDVVDGGARILVYSGPGGAVVIPSAIAGYPTRYIGSTSGHYAFSATAITSITLPSSILSIGKWAFQTCPLTSVKLNEGLQSIGDGAFQGCTALTSIIIPTTVTSMGQTVFWQCSNLTSITFYSYASPSVSNTNWILGTNAGITGHARAASNFPVPGQLFYNLPMGTNIPDILPDGDYVYTLSGGNATITQYTGDGGVVVIPATLGGYPTVGIADWTFVNNFRITKLTTPASLISIGIYAFMNCTAMTELVIGRNLISISDHMCWGCTTLSTIIIPTSVTSIAADAFGSCPALLAISIPASVTSIGIRAFLNCTNLASITFQGLVAPTLMVTGWIGSNAEGLLGHASRISNFPIHGNTWYGLLMGDASNAVVPFKPGSLMGMPSNDQITLTWSIPIDDGGSAITGYKVYYGTSTNPTGQFNSTFVPTTATVTGLTPLTKYYFRVRAINAIGDGELSTEATVTTIATPEPPGVPRSLFATTGDAKITLNWDAPSTNGGRAIDYYVVYKDGSLTPLSMHVRLGTSTEVTGLINGVNYTFAVAAHNSIGTGTKTTAITASPEAPRAPTADFYTYPTYGLKPLTARFQNTSTGIPTSWLWNFGDGATAVTENPTHTYSTIGTYTVTLTVTNALGSDVKTEPGYINVTGIPSGNAIGIFDGVMYIDLSQTFGHGAVFTDNFQSLIDDISNYIGGYWEGTINIGTEWTEGI